MKIPTNNITLGLMIAFILLRWWVERTADKEKQYNKIRRDLDEALKIKDKRIKSSALNSLIQRLNRVQNIDS